MHLYSNHVMVVMVPVVVIVVLIAYFKNNLPYLRCYALAGCFDVSEYDF